MMSSSTAPLLQAIWFGRLAVTDGFLAPEDFSEQLFSFVCQSPEEPFDERLVKEGMLTAFQQKKLTERLPPLPDGCDVAALLAGAEASPSEPESAPVSTLRTRYQLGDIIQQGGSGRIYRAYDKVIGRDVAIKCLLHPESERARKRFENEYKITGSLDHPNIVSVHDASYDDELGPFYVMRLLEGHTLRERLRQAQESGHPGRTALLRSYLELCAAVAYAHSRGVVHRDLKPSNIMVGEFGEVQVMDWGIARRVIDHNLPTPSPDAQHDELLQGAVAPGMTHVGAILGTPGYMSPEQAKGELHVDHRADVFALGCILYELLVGRFPFQGTQPEEYLRSVEKGPPPSPSSIDPSISEELDEIVTQALAYEPERRFASVRALSGAIAIYLEGTRTQKLREQRSLSKVAEGIQARSKMQANESEADSLLRQLRGEQARIRPYDAIERKRQIWEKEEKVEELEEDVMVLLGDAITSFTQALALDPKSAEAQSQLADLHYERLLAAERKRDRAQIAYQEAMLRQHNDGRYDLFLKNEGAIWLLSDPPGARVTIHQLEEKERILQPAEGTVLGDTPLGPVTLSTGSYLAVFEHEHFATTHVPVLVQREKRNIYRARLYREEDLPTGYKYMPQGRFVMGGDPLTASAGRIERPFVSDLFVATFPVTMADYLRFLNEAHDGDPLHMQRHVPRRSPDGGFYLPCSDEIGWELPGIDEDGDEWDPMFPVLAISWFDGEAYAKWKAAETGLPYRLPLSNELEKAARGVDGRYYPWGDRFDATFCKMARSRPGVPKPEPVGAYPLDCSVYGIRDLGGGIREWCGDRMEGEDAAIAFGGNWSGSELTSRAAHRWHLQKGQVAPGIGVRLAMDAEPCSYHKGFQEIEDQQPISLVSEPAKRVVASASSGAIRERLSDPKLWEALSEERDEWALTQLALSATHERVEWAVIQMIGEDVPLASAGAAPDAIPSAVLVNAIQELREPSTFTEEGTKHEAGFVIFPCGEPPLGCLVLPKEHSLLEPDVQALRMAISLVLRRRAERLQTTMREQQALTDIADARKELTIVREALATVAPETFLREAYPLLDGRSAPMQRLFQMLDRLSTSEVNVFIRGESGVGKERVARTIHQTSPFKEGPFVAVNCGAIPENLVESELFGYVKGAFTGADKEQPGLFRQAHGGTLFLDEVAELSLSAQVKLLRVLQNRAVRPVGGTVEYPFDARILVATHEDLKQYVSDGEFREDLYWRLVVMEVHIPPLRERPEDIPVLIRRFLDDWQQTITISEEALTLLQAYPWPGNIRELENELRRALVVADATIEPLHLSERLRHTSGGSKTQRLQGKLRDIVAQVEADAIQFALKQANGNKSETARKLGLSKRGLQLKMERYHISS